MIKRRFTGGKWKVQDNGVIYSTLPSNNGIVWLVSWTGDEEEREANVRLIESAPEMFTMLEELIPHLEAFHEINVVREVREFLARINGDDVAVTNENHIQVRKGNVYDVPMRDASTCSYRLDDLQVLIREHRTMKELLSRLHESLSTELQAMTAKKQAISSIKDFLKEVKS